jgi:hypothetical protein
LESASKPSWVTRILTVAFLGFLGYLVIVSFYKASPSFAISAGILIILALMTVLVLSEAFNSFSIGKLLTLSREVEISTREKQEIKTDNVELRKALVQLAVNVHQSQVNATINTNGVDLLKALGVVKADKSDEDQEQEVKLPTVPAEFVALQDREARMKSYRIRSMADALAFDKYIEANALPKIDVEREIQFSASFENLDPIMERKIVFDGYMKTPNKEYFFEVRNHRNVTPMFWDRLYVMLSKVLFYREAKKVPTELILIISKLPEPDGESEGRYFERFIQAFQPAIASGILRVEQIEISQSELDVITNNFQNEHSVAKQ